MKKRSIEKQKQILNYIYSQVKQKGYPPSVREICKGLNIKSTSTVHGYIEKLIAEGYLEKDPTKPRAIKVLKNIESSGINSNIKETVDVPIIGKVAAGQPILAVENVEDTLPFPLELTGNGETFILTVVGDSMIDVGIFENDYIIVNKQSNANNGDIVVALINEEATVKTFFREKDHIRLQPENSRLSPIIVKEKLNILGKVVGVYRKL